jgi:hypothetical protein
MRPTKYSEDMLAKAQGYVVDPNAHVPTVAGLSRYLGVARNTMYVWARDYADFAEVLDDLMAEQQVRLINGGLGGDYNSTIAKLMLANHGYHDKTDNTLIGADGGPVEIIERAIVKANDSDG